MDLFDDNCSDDLKFSINENYASRYDKWRQGEELQKLKDKYGDEVPSSPSSTSEDEDEDARELTEDVERNFFKTLSCLKEKNPKIYDEHVRFFESKPGTEKKKGVKKKSKDSMSLGEYQRKILLEKGGQFSDDDNEEGEKSFKDMTNTEQEKVLKECFKDVLKDSDSESERNGWGCLFKRRIKTEDELKTEEENYKLWLVGEKKKLKNSEEEKELKGLHDYWSDPKLDEGEKFLRDYILNKRFLDKGVTNTLPTYEDVVHSSDSDLSADETILEQQEEFERKYNFRFEEPDQEFIKRYPRTLERSMRRKNDKRKRHREEVKARKEREKAQKTEELTRLKSLKRKEILEKIKKLQEITGNKDMGFQKTDIEDDFDPEEHDKRMSELFNDDYYGACEDEEKPENRELDEELEIENWDEWAGEEKAREDEELHCEDPGFNMDCDYDPNQKKNLQNELIESTKRRKRRRQSKFSAAVTREKPVFDPKDKTFEKYVDEYYSLDYEDLIGDLPCRFKYRKVVPNDFGLTVEEILAAPDKELNRWASVKKITQRRPEHVELYEVKAFKKKASDFNKKKKCLPSLYAPENENEESASPRNNPSLKTTEKSIGKIKNRDSKSKDSIGKKIKVKGKKNLHSLQSENGITARKNKKKFKSTDKFREKKNSQDSVSEISDDRLKSYGINPKKMKNKLKYGKNQKNLMAYTKK